MKLYRFRKIKNNAVKQFCTNSISGSRFDGLFEDDLKSEIRITLDKERLEILYGVDVSIMNRFEEELRNYLIQNYYVICFSSINQIKDMQMWKRYADCTGYCLVYDETQLEDALGCVKERGIAIIGQVEKSEKPVDITFIIDRIINYVEKNNNSEKQKKYAFEHWTDLITPQEAEKLVDVFFNKIGD